MRPLLLSHADVVAHLQSPALLADLRRAFVTHTTAARVEPEGRGWLEGIPASTERVVGGLPETGGRDVVLLREEPSGKLLAVIELAHLDAVTRALVGALAVDALAAPDARHVAILGAGPDAARQLKLLRLVRSLDSLRVWDADLSKAQDLATRLHQQMGLSTAASVSVEEAVRRAGVVLCCEATAAQQLGRDDLAPGAHVNLLTGPEALRSRDVEEGRSLASLAAVYENPVDAPTHQPPHGAATLGSVLTAEQPPFASDSRTVFVGSRLPFQDLVAAWQLFEVLREDPDVARLTSEA